MALAICFEDGGLAGLGRRDDQAALAASNGGDQVEQAGGQLVRVGFQVEADSGKIGVSVLEVRALSWPLRGPGR